MLGLVACVAVNIWCFRVNVLLGFIGLNVTKHVVIAQLCQAIGVNRRTEPAAASASPPEKPDEVERPSNLFEAVN